MFRYECKNLPKLNTAQKLEVAYAYNVEQKTLGTIKKEIKEKYNIDIQRSSLLKLARNWKDKIPAV